MSSQALPTSRIDALTVVASAVFAVFFGATPKKGKVLSLVFTIGANVWAIASSVLSFRDLLDDHALEPWVRFFTFVLLVTTIYSSSIILWAFAFPKSGINELGVFVGPLVVLLVGLGALCAAFFRGCDDNRLKGTHFCHHSPFATIGAVVAALLVTVVLGVIVFVVTLDGADGVLPSLCCGNFFDVKDDDSDAKDDTSYVQDDDSAITVVDPETTESTDAATLEGPVDFYPDHPALSPDSALVARENALVKLCLLIVYWFLVDDDLSWDYFQGHDVNWWATGQYAKHGVAIANNFFNYLNC